MYRVLNVAESEKLRVRLGAICGLAEVTTDFN